MFLRELVGKNDDIKDALKRLDWLTQEEARMSAAQVLKVASTVDGRVRRLIQDVSAIEDRVTSIGYIVQATDYGTAVNLDSRLKATDYGTAVNSDDKSK